MFRFITIYRKVDDESVLENFFHQTHLPLAERLPNVRHVSIGRVRGKPGGESRFHMLVDAAFDSSEDFDKALRSKAGMALMQALKPWDDAQLVTWFYYDAWGEEKDANTAKVIYPSGLLE